ncbi:mCG1036176 [Mus musculus]|nr:mCG1036176 [Mus musculus]
MGEGTAAGATACQLHCIQSERDEGQCSAFSPHPS